MNQFRTSSHLHGVPVTVDTCSHNAVEQAHQIVSVSTAPAGHQNRQHDVGTDRENKHKIQNTQFPLLLLTLPSLQNIIGITHPSPMCKGDVAVYITCIFSVLV